MKPLLGAVAVLLGLVGYPIYLRGILRGSVRPSIASWTAWWCSTLVVAGGQIAAGAGWGMALTGAQLVGLGTVVVASTRRSRWQPTRLDYVCVGCAVAGAAISIVVGDPTAAVLACVAGNIAAGTPTYLTVARRPQDEEPVLWLAAGVAGGLAALAAPSLTLARAGYGIYLFIFNTGIGLAALRRPTVPRRVSGEGTDAGRGAAPHGSAPSELVRPG